MDVNLKPPQCPSRKSTSPASVGLLDDRLVNVPQSSLQTGNFSKGYGAYMFNGAVERCGNVLPAAARLRAAAKTHHETHLRRVASCRCTVLPATDGRHCMLTQRQ